MLILVLAILVNLVGTLGPELGFDALWYHLTIIKIFIDKSIFTYIPGNLLYYSVMPKSIDFLFTPALMFTNEIAAKIIHYLFGILSMLMLYKTSRIILPRNLSLIVLVIFYSSLVVGWMSITAYIDLGTAFFEITALYLLVKLLIKPSRDGVFLLAIFLGISLTTKFVSYFTLMAIISFSAYFFMKEKGHNYAMGSLIILAVVPILIILPWLTYSYLLAGNPIYPLFDSKLGIADISMMSTMLSLPKLIINSLISLSDPINPIFLIVSPLVILYYRKLNLIEKRIVILGFIYLVTGAVISQIGGGRFLIGYTGTFSIITGIVILRVISEKKLLIYNSLIVCVFLVAFSSILYRGVANSRYINYILGRETKSEFLTKNLNFGFGDFYDTDNFFRSNIQNKVVKLVGFHNLYYIDFPYIDSSWMDDGKYDYTAIQLNNYSHNNNYIYSNDLTNVKVYED